MVHQELKRKGVTLQLLWAEYKEAATEPARCYQYTQFCRHYHTWAGTLEPVLRRVLVARERLFVDLGASHLLYVEAIWTQALPRT